MVGVPGPQEGPVRLSKHPKLLHSGLSGPIRSRLFKLLHLRVVFPLDVLWRSFCGPPGSKGGPPGDIEDRSEVGPIVFSVKRGVITFKVFEGRGPGTYVGR